MPGSKKPEKDVDAARNKVSRRTFLATGGAIVAVDAPVIRKKPDLIEASGINSP